MTQPGHEHGPEHAAHGHGDPYVWQPAERRSRAGWWLVALGAALLIGGWLLSRAAPDWAREHFEEGQALAAQGQREAALELLQDAVRLAPGNAEYVAALAAQYRALGRFEEAASATERLTRLSPGRWEPWAELGELRLELGQLELLEAALGEARELAPLEPRLTALEEQLRLRRAR